MIKDKQRLALPGALLALVLLAFFLLYQRQRPKTNLTAPKLSSEPTTDWEHFLKLYAFMNTSPLSTSSSICVSC